MRATVLLADSAQLDPTGKVHALGLGWQGTTTPTPPHALIVFIDVGWDETNRRFPLRAELIDGDGNAVTAQTPVGEQPLQIDGTLEAGRPSGLPPGSSVRLPFCTAIGPGLNLAVGQRYQWRVSINNETHEDWSASFTILGPTTPNPTPD